MPPAPSRLYRFARRAYWTAMCALIQARAGGRVYQGPFAGMRYRLGAVFSASVPKLLGTYERELHAAVGALGGQGWRTIVDVGAAEGYYAVGLGLRSAGAKVIAFEADPTGRQLLRENVARNGLEGRVEVRGTCTGEELARVLREAERPALAVLDVEGAEADLLSAVAPEDLGRATLLVEIHDFHVRAGEGPIARRVQALLAATHDIEAIQTRPRREEEFPPAFWFVPRRNRRHAMDEYRPSQMSWFLCRPRAA